MPGNGAALAATGRTKRASALMAQAKALPSVETSLDEFIARANSTLLDAANWDKAEKDARAVQEQRAEADQLRAESAEQLLRESEAREHALRKQLNGLQGQLAEAEARAAVGAANTGRDAVVADLKNRLARAEQRAEQLEDELANRPAASSGGGEDLSERLRVAEAKAIKAIAVAKAAQAGLNVSSDLAAIESGLVAPLDIEPAPRKTPWLAVFAALLVGGGVMFGVQKFVLDNGASKPAPAPAAAAAAPAPAPAAAAPAPAPAPAPAAEPAKPTVTPIEETAPAPAAAAADPAVEMDKPAPAAAPTPAPVAAAPKKAAPAPAPKKVAPPAKKAPAAANKGPDLADPFGGGQPQAAPAKAAKPAAKPADKKPAAGLADPF